MTLNWKILPFSSLQVSKGLSCWEGLQGAPLYPNWCHRQKWCLVGPPQQPQQVRGKHRGWPGAARVRPSQGYREAICLLHQLSSPPTYPSPSVMTFSCSHFWQLPDTVSQTSLEANYHTNCQRQKTWPDCCPTSTPAYKSFLNKTAQNKQNTTLMYIQLPRETICPRL